MSSGQVLQDRYAWIGIGVINPVKSLPTFVLYVARPLVYSDHCRLTCEPPQ